MERKKFNIVFLGPDGAGKTTILNELIIQLRQNADNIEIIHLKPNFRKKQLPSQKAVTEPHKKKPRSAIISIGKIMSWVLLFWIDSLRHNKVGVTIRFWDRYFHDVIVDPKRYRYGAPEWTVKFIGKLIPTPDLWILLDARPEILQARKQEVSFMETDRQRKAYIEFVASRVNFGIIDVERPVQKIVADIKLIIVKLIEKP